MDICMLDVSPDAASKRASYMGPDRLSDLPDALLTKIISFLKARAVAQTCVLSKRWRRLWCSVPCLHFDLEEFTNPNPVGAHERFRNFVTTFLFYHSKAVNLDVFYLNCKTHAYYDNDYDENSISVSATMWIAEVLKRKPKKLQLAFSVRNLPVLPKAFYICDSLEELHLSLGHNVDKKPLMPERICMPKLTRLCLCSVYINEDYMDKVLHGCPMLESLSLEGCILDMPSVSFGTLKWLSMRYCYFLWPDFLVSAPKLEYLSVVEDIVDDLVFDQMHKLTQASIIFEGDMESEYDLDSEYSAALSNLVNAEVIEFSSRLLHDILEEESSKFSTFFKLKRLTLGDCCMNCAFHSLSYLLQHTPKLETLTLVHQGECCKVKGGHDGKNKKQHPREKVRWLSCQYLKKVEILYASQDGVQQLVGRVTASTERLNEVLIVVSIR